MKFSMLTRIKQLVFQILVALTVLCSLLFSNVYAQETQQIAQGKKVVGQVLDKNENPVSHWPIKIGVVGAIGESKIESAKGLSAKQKTYIAALTDANGQFQVFLPPGKYMVNAMNQPNLTGKIIEVKEESTLVKAEPLRFNEVVEKTP